MNNLYVVKGELAGWALGLEEPEAPTFDELVAVYGRPDLSAPKRRKRRRGHEGYRLPFRRGELTER
jgi:hypothetical protein